MIVELSNRINHYRISSFKHNGVNYRNWSPVYKLKFDGDGILFHNPFWKTKVYEDSLWKAITKNSKSLNIELSMKERMWWKPKFSSLWYFHEKKFYNVLCILESDNKVAYYINLSSPPTVLNRRVGFIDYDIDYKISTNGEIKIRDKNEFKMYKELFKYSNNLVRVLEGAEEQLMNDYENDVFPFNSEEVKEFLILKNNKESE